MKNVIYKIRNVVNDKFYVGSTVDSRKRFWAHRKALRLGNHDCIYLQRAWNKYGEDCFKFEIVEQLNAKEELFPAEQKWLDEHFGKEHCYNVAAHADSPMRDASLEIRAKLSTKAKEWHENNGHPRQGHKCTPEEIAHMSEQRKGKATGESHYRYGKTVSEETRKKIGDTQRGKPKAPGRTVSAEGMAKIRAASEAGHYSHWEGRNHTEESKLKMSKAVVVVYPDGASKLYNSITELRNDTGLKAPTINRALKSEKPISRGEFEGWEFFYANDFFALDTPE
jgi:group I intron endonuclease